jgi:hypothetical protein
MIAIKSPAEIAGRWKGTLLLFGKGETHATLRIDSDGTYSFKGSKYSETNTFRIEGGKAITGRDKDGTITLHAGDGKRFLATQNEWGTGRFTLAK